jgi:hypothetical protein
MGYNPYKCIICGNVKNNGWGYDIDVLLKLNFLYFKSFNNGFNKI